MQRCTDGKGGQRDFTLPAAVLETLTFSATTKVSLQVPKGETEGPGGRLSMASSQGAHSPHHSCRSAILLHHWHRGQNPSSDPLQVWGGHVHQPGCSPRPRAALTSSSLPWAQAGAGELALCQQKALPPDCCWSGSHLVCAIRFALLHAHPEHPADSSAQRGPSAPLRNAEHPTGLYTGLAGKEEVSQGS